MVRFTKTVRSSPPSLVQASFHALTKAFLSRSCRSSLPFEVTTAELGSMAPKVFLAR